MKLLEGVLVRLLKGTLFRAIIYAALLSVVLFLIKKRKKHEARNLKLKEELL